MPQRSRPGSAQVLPVPSSASASSFDGSSSSSDFAAESAKSTLARPSSAASLLAQKLSFGRRKSLSGSSSPSAAIVERALYAGSRGQLAALHELVALLQAADPASAEARDAYAAALEHRLVTRMLQSSHERLPKDSPLLQVTLSCLTYLSCVGGPLHLCNSIVAGLIVRAMRPESSLGNQRAALACVHAISADAGCVELLRAAQAEPLLKRHSGSSDVTIRVPACGALHNFREVPDATLQVGFSSLRAPNVTEADQHRALHGIARFLGSLAPDSHDGDDVRATAAARDACKAEGFAAALVQLLREHELRLGLKRGEGAGAAGGAAGGAFDTAERRSVLPQLAVTCLTNVAAIGGQDELFAAGATEALLGAVTHEDTTVRHYALTGLSNLCSYPGAASVIREHEAMGRLRKLASHANHPAATQPLKYAARIVGIVSEDAACATGEIVDAASSSSTSISQDSGSQDTPRSGSPQDTPRSS